jgi:hypothetical protein
MDKAFTAISERGTSPLFDACVDLFNYIQFDSSLNLHYDDLPLKFDIAKCRLARLGTHRDGKKPFEDFLEED